MSGVGFLGAATIFKKDNTQVVGLTTAAGVWVVAGIGLAVGYGYYAIGGMTALLVLVIQDGVFFFLKPKWWKQVCRCMSDETVFDTEGEEQALQEQEIEPGRSQRVMTAAAPDIDDSATPCSKTGPGTAPS